MPKVSLIISTYNWPKALSLCLQSVMRQSRMPDEIIVADDGSRDDTRRVVEHFAAISPVPLRHVWHEDDGFRLTVIRNKAMAVAEGDYLIQIDGDLLLHRDFVKEHVARAKRGFYLVGSRVILSETLSHGILERGVFGKLFFWSRGLRNRLNSLHFRLLSSLLKTKRVLARGCNMSFWRDDIVAVNGYNEQMKGWGSEDAEMAIRLHNRGLQARPLKFAGIAYHLYHPEAKRDSASQNFAIQQQTEREHSVRCELGISQYL